MKPNPVTEAVFEFAGAVQSFSEDDLAIPWKWNDYEEGIRFAFFRVYEELCTLAVQSASQRQASPRPLTEAQLIFSQYHAAYRDLQAVLLDLSDAQATLAPGADEWPIFEILAHIIDADASFLFANLVAVEQRRGSGLPPHEYSDASWKAFWIGDPFEEIKEKGSLSALQAYYENLHRRILERLISVSADELETPARSWETVLMPVRFRMHRFDAHLRQHTIHAEKVLQSLLGPPSETKRLLRLIFQALAEWEGNRLDGWEEDSGLAAQTAKEIQFYLAEIKQALRK